MDEPLSNLDAKLRVQMRAQLSLLHERLGTTTIYVTHDQVEAMTLGQRVAVLKDGVLQQVDTPQNLYMHPANLFVARVHRLAAHEPGRSTGAGGTGLVRRIRHRAPSRLDLPALRGPDRDPRASGPPTWRTPPSGSNDELPTIEVIAEVTEELGSEVNVIFTVDAPPVLTEDTIKAASDEGGADNMSLIADEKPLARFCARVDARSDARPDTPSRSPSTPRGSTTSTRRRARRSTWIARSRPGSERAAPRHRDRR